MLKIKDYLLRNKDVLHIENVANAVGINKSTMRKKLQPAGKFSEDESFKIREKLRGQGVTTQRKRVTAGELQDMSFIKTKPLVDRTGFTNKEGREIWQRIYDNRPLNEHASLSQEEIEKALGKAIREVAEGL